MSNERRKDQRSPLPLEVRWEAHSGKSVARVSDLSMGGCYIETLGEVIEGERISFQIQLPNNEWLQLEGVVIYKHPNFGFGVRFDSLSDSRKEILASVLRTPH